MKIALCVFTDGRGEYLVRTMQSLTERIAYQFDYALMVDDSGNTEYAQWLDRMFPTFRHLHHAQRIGFAGAIRDAWFHTPKCDYQFSLEDDFTFNENIDIPKLACILDATPKLSQIVYLRQPWNSAEKEVGGIIQLHPDWYTEREVCGVTISEHTANYSTNPNLMRHSLTYFHDTFKAGKPSWPMEEQSEGKYGAWVRAQGYHFAFYGCKSDGPRVTHIGEKRVGNGY